MENRVLYRLYKVFCTSKVSYVFTVHMECNFVYASKKSTGFPKPIFTELTNHRLHYVQNIAQAGQEIIYAREEIHLHP